MALSAADGDGRVNYFMPMADDEHYGALLKHIFDGGDLFEAMDLATQLEMSLDSADYPEWMKDAALARALMIVARYCTQISDSYDGIASGYMSDADGLVASSREKGAPESVVGVLEALSNSFWYLIDGSLSKAMKFPSAVDRLYKEHPEDFHVLLMAAELKEDAGPLNQVRARSGLAPVSYTLENLQNERRWELAFEGLRYYDLLRWGIAGEALAKQNGVAVKNDNIDGTISVGNVAQRLEETGGFLFIPPIEIELSDYVLTQTQGW